MKPARPTGYQTGLWAEMRAAVYLRLKGYRILARRFKTPAGEIDLVARKGGTLVFVEVKLRADEASAMEAIHAKNRQRVWNAAELYLQRHPDYTRLDMRFDALVFTRARKITHIENAWGI